MSDRTILVVDDEVPIQRLLARMLAGPGRTVIAAGDGLSALTLAAERKPDLILLDVNMPKKNGWEVLEELRRRAATLMTPVIMLTSESSVGTKVGGLKLGADDYITKPFAAEELRARVDCLLRRNGLALSANPLTGLPGNSAIEEEVSSRLSRGEDFAFLYVDIDRFKQINDVCGFAAGDALIKETAALIRRCVGELGFTGHIGGDDFIAICATAEAAYAAQRLAVEFDERAVSFIPAAKRDKVRVPTLSIGVVTPARRKLATYARISEVAAELKAYLKSEKSRALSRFAFDRRAGR